MNLRALKTSTRPISSLNSRLARRRRLIVWSIDSWSPLFRFLMVVLTFPKPTRRNSQQTCSWWSQQNWGGFQFNERARLTTWIFQVAKNRAIDYHRQSKPDSCELDDSVVGAYGRKKAAFGSYTSRNPHLHSWLANELAGLSEQDRQILNWRALDFRFCANRGVAGDGRRNGASAPQKSLGQAQGGSGTPNSAGSLSVMNEKELNDLILKGIRNGELHWM